LYTYYNQNRHIFGDYSRYHGGCSVGQPGPCGPTGSQENLSRYQKKHKLKILKQSAKFMKNKKY
jgi:hypothetical protein